LKLTTCRASFKRKQKQPQPKLSLPKFLQPAASSSGPRSSNHTSARIRRLREQSNGNGSDISLSVSNGHVAGDGEGKDGAPLDWYGGGPRHRVGYDDLTAIDWIFEYTKERQRLRMLAAKTAGMLGMLQQFWDASQIWLVLVGTGASAGILAAAIDVASRWLADLKTGYCRAGDGGGHFYLNKQFCCWGLDETSQCQDWTPWGVALGIGPRGGKYVVEYIFFTIFSVIPTFRYVLSKANVLSGTLRYLCKCSCTRLCSIRKTQRNTRDKDGTRRLRHQKIHGRMDACN
jgi:chloride channel 3/4/5